MERRDTQSEMKRKKKCSQHHARYDYHTRTFISHVTYTQCVFLAHFKNIRINSLSGTNLNGCVLLVPQRNTSE